MPLHEVKGAHVWMLSGVEVELDRAEQVVHRVRAPRRTPSEEALDEAIAALADLEVDRVWVTRKVPLLVVLWPACVAALLFGDVAGLLLHPWSEANGSGSAALHVLGSQALVAALAATLGPHCVAGVALHADLAMQHARLGLRETSHEPATASLFERTAVLSCRKSER